MAWAFLGKLLGTDKALATGADIAAKATSGIISGIDAAFYTKEEHVNDVKEVLFKLQDQYTPRSASRRLIAVMAMGVFCLYALVALGVIVAAIFLPFEAAPVIVMLIDTASALYLPWIILTIITFYFGYYGWKKIKEAAPSGGECK